MDDIDARERSVSPARGSFGQWLRGQREARGVSVPEIAQSSKISVRYLEALEADRFEVLPAPVFVRGFLREYARVVGLDADEVVNLFLVAAPRVPSERRPESTGGRPGSSSRSSSSGSSVGRGLLVAFAVLLVLGIAAGIAYWATRRSSAAAPPSSAVATGMAPGDSSASASGTAPDTASGTLFVASSDLPIAEGLATPPAEVPETGDGAPAEAAAPVSDAAAPGPGAEVVQPILAPAPTAPSFASPAVVAKNPADGSTLSPPATGPLVVVLAFQQDCWVETRVDGGRRASELKAGGETLTLEARESIVLTLGNAPAVRAELNGRLLTLPADSSRLLREFRIDRSLIADPNPTERPQPSQP